MVGLRLLYKGLTEKHRSPFRLYVGNHNGFNDNINNNKASARQKRYDICVMCLFLTVSWVGLRSECDRAMTWSYSNAF